MHSYSDVPSLECLTALLVAAEAGSFSAAAEQLGLTHGSISRRIGLIETWLGTTVFERHGRGVRLTPAGQRFAADAERSLAAIARSADQWRPSNSRYTVRVSVTPSFARLWLLSRLQSLQGAAADLRIEVNIEHRLTDMDAGESDVAIRYGRGDWSGLRAQLLFAEELVAVAAPRLAAQLPKNPDASHLLAHPLLHDSDTSHWRAWLAPTGTRYRPRSQDRRFEDYDTVLAAADAGLGITLLRVPLASAWLAHGRLVVVSKRRIANPSRHYVVTRQNEERAGVLELAKRLLRSASVGGGGYVVPEWGR